MMSFINNVGRETLKWRTNIAKRNAAPMEAWAKMDAKRNAAPMEAWAEMEKKLAQIGEFWSQKPIKGQKAKIPIRGSPCFTQAHYV